MQVFREDASRRPRGRPRAGEPKTTLHLLLPIDVVRALDTVTSNRTQFVYDLLVNDPEVFAVWSAFKIAEAGPDSPQAQTLASVRAARGLPPVETSPTHLGIVQNAHHDEPAERQYRVWSGGTTPAAADRDDDDGHDANTDVDGDTGQKPVVPLSL